MTMRDTEGPVNSAPEPSPAVRPAPRGGRVRRAIFSVVGLLHDWAESGWAGSAVGTWSLLQGSLVPGPAEALLVPLGISDPPRVPRLALWAFAGAMAGGCIAWLVGVHAFDEIGRPLLGFIGVGPEMLERTRGLFEQRGWAIVILSAVSPLSTKLVCIAAGAFGVPFLPFVASLAVGRAARFTVVALLVRFAGERVLGWLTRRS